MSAGTIFALSAACIMMDYLSSLGPIDPQIERDGKLVPALSYLNQFERLNDKAQTGALTTAEYALVSKLDLGELNNTERWHSHGRAIDMKTLQEEVGLKILDLADNHDLHNDIRNYFELLKDYMHRENIMSFVHTREYF